MPDKNVLENLKKFKKLIETAYPVDKLILFGSYAKGKAKEDSDIDVAVVLKKKRLDNTKIEVDLKLKSLEIDPRIFPFVFSKEEFKKPSPLKEEIRKYGIII